MHLLITGGSGLIGRSLTARLADKGHQLTVLTRNASKTRQRLGANITLCQTLDDDALQGIDAVINLAGESISSGRWTRTRKQRLCQSRWQITQRLAQLINASKTPPAVFISASAVGYYGDSGDNEIDEHSPPHDGFTHQLCQQWEQLALSASPHSRVCLLRTGVVLCANGGMLARLLPIWRAGLGGRIGNGRQYLAWIHIDDMINAILWLLQQPLSGAFNLTAPQPVSNASFSRSLADALHRPALLAIPAPVMRCLLGEAATLLLDSQRILPQRLLHSGFQFRHPHLPPALHHLLSQH